MINERIRGIPECVNASKVVRALYGAVLVRDITASEVLTLPIATADVIARTAPGVDSGIPSRARQIEPL